MATAIPGITGYIPQTQPWRPDLNFYNAALQRRQSQYDAAYNKVSSLYGSLLNAPMTRDSNIERRNAFFKTINNDIKKISTMDLSLQQNVDSAMELFRPFYEDENIVNDMTFTKKLQTQQMRGESYKNCTDPAKCNGQYWDGGMRYLTYMQEEFKKASDEEALSMRAPEFVPYFNITDLATKIAKDRGFKITTVNSQGGYLVTETNGMQQILPLESFFKSEFGNNADIMKMYNVMSVLKRKDFVKDNAYKFDNDESKAESVYIQGVLSKYEKAINKQVDNAKNDHDTVKNNIEAIKQHVEQNGAIPGGDEAKDFNSLFEQLGKAESVVKQTEDAKNTYESIPTTIGDMKAMRSKADFIETHSLFNEDMRMAAAQYAMNTYTQKKQVDPYVLENTKFKHRLAAMSQQFGYNVELFKMKDRAQKENLYLKGLIDAEKIKLKKKNAIIDAHGTEDENTFEALEETVGGATAAGSTNVLMDTQKAYVQYANQALSDKAKILDDTVTYLLNQATSTDSTGAVARNQLKKILGNNYNAANNSLVNSKGQAVNNVENAVDITKISAMSGTALDIVKSTSLYKGFYNDVLRKSEQSLIENTDMQTAQMDIIKKSNAVIKSHAQSSTKIKAEDKADFASLFDKTNYTYSKEVWSKNYAKKTGVDLDDAEDRYDELYDKYKEIYKQGATGAEGYPNLVFSASMLPGGASFVKGTTGKYSSGGKAPFSGLSNTSKPALALYSYTKNADDAGRAKAVFADDITKDDYKYFKDNENAWQLFKAISADMKKGGFKASDKVGDIPQGDIIYRAVSANDPNLVSVTLKPNAQYLRKFVSTKNKKSFLSEEEYTRALKGITVFMDKSKATKNLFHEMGKHSKYDIMAAGDIPININVKGTADNVSIKKTGDRIVTGGFLYEKYFDPNTNTIKTEKLNASMIPSSNIALGDYVDRLKYLVDVLDQKNRNIQAKYDANYLKYNIDEIMMGQNPNQVGVLDKAMTEFNKSINTGR